MASSASSSPKEAPIRQVRQKFKSPTIQISQNDLYHQSVISQPTPKRFTSPVSLLKARRGSIHFGSEFESKLASIQRDSKKDKKLESLKSPVSLHLRQKSDLNPFFHRNGFDSLESAQAFRQAQATSAEEATESADLENEWKTLLNSKNWRSSEKLGELMQSGIPPSQREEVWKVFLRCEKIKSHYANGYYQRLVQLSKEVQDDQKKEIFQIDKDLRRTMPNCELFKTKEGIDKLRRVLYAYALRNPDNVGYCQGMNFVCAGLLTVLSEEDAFWGLCVLIEIRLGYYTPSMISLKVDQSVLNRMISYKHPKLYRHMVKLGVSIYAFTTSWFLCLFMENPLPYSSAIRFWDNLFCYGDEMLFHMALEIMLHKSEDLLAIEDADELLSYTLHKFQKEMTAESIKRITQKIGTLVDQIGTLREYYQKVETVQATESRLDCTTLASRMGFSSPEEINHLWKLFVEPEPWDILLTESHAEVSWFAYSFHRACYPKEPDSFCAHGLMSGVLHRLFDTLDVHNTGNIPFKKFLRAVHTLRYGGQLERLKLCFNFFDIDGDGFVGMKDFKLGIGLVSDMIEGDRSDGEKQERDAFCSELMYRSYQLKHCDTKYIEKTFSSGPFGLQLKTHTTSRYPSIKRILIESTVKKGIKVGWQLISINGISFKEFDEDRIYEVIKTVKFPATCRFRSTKYPKVENPNEAMNNEKMTLEDFSNVIHHHAKTYALFRLHGNLLEHWRPDGFVSDDEEEEEEAKEARESQQRRSTFSFWSFGKNRGEKK